MPVVIPEDLIPTGGDIRMAYFATVHEGVLCEGQPTESYRTSDWTVNVRLMVYCGTFSDEHFASHVCALMRGGVSNLPGAHRAIACNMRLDEADALGLNLGMGCWNPRCTRVAPIKLPKAIRRTSNDRLRGAGEMFKKCKRCECAHYCSRGCQRLDWARHKKCCEDIKLAYLVDRRRETHDEQKVHTSFGFGTSYDYCLWAHLVGRTQSPDARTPVAVDDVVPCVRRDPPVALGGQRLGTVRWGWRGATAAGG